MNRFRWDNSNAFLLLSLCWSYGEMGLPEIIASRKITNTRWQKWNKLFCSSDHPYWDDRVSLKDIFPQELGRVEFAQEFRATEEQWTEPWNGNLLNTSVHIYENNIYKNNKNLQILSSALRCSWCGKLSPNSVHTKFFNSVLCSLIGKLLNR